MEYRNIHQNIIESQIDFEIKQNIIFNNLRKNYILLLQQILFCSFYNSNNFLYMPKLLNFNQIPKLSLINEQGMHTETYLNKKTLREEKMKERKLKDISTKKSKKKIFYIKKITDKEKEAGEEKKLKKYIYRGSKYRGVSRNGKTWQVLIMVNRNKNYFGNFKSEDEAAKKYDEYAMKYHKNKARLNFSHLGYTTYVNKP